jgi:hypothetical protein
VGNRVDPCTMALRASSGTRLTMCLTMAFHASQGAEVGRAYRRQVAAQMQQASGRPPAGWASPWIAETALTPDLLHESGYEYLLDWCMDD